MAVNKANIVVLWKRMIIRKSREIAMTPVLASLTTAENGFSRDNVQLNRCTSVLVLFLKSSKSYSLK